MKHNIKIFVFALAFIFLLLVLICLSHIVYTSFINKLSLENYVKNIVYNNIDNTFNIDKIVFFSSCSADSSINSNNTATINNLSQYTDIAIFINNSTNEFSLENTLKSVSIHDISFNVSPKLGSPNLYYKGLTSFATPDISPNNLLDSDFDFSISSSDEIDYNQPILFNNCANPITLSYVNSNIKSEYTVDSSSIVYDGSLLKNCNVLLSDLNCSLSFNIFIENNLGKRFSCPVYIDIPLSDDSTSIYDGSYTFSYNPDYKFYAY